MQVEDVRKKEEKGRREGAARITMTMPKGWKRLPNKV
jgi:hypothetical protein